MTGQPGSVGRYSPAPRRTLPAAAVAGLQEAFRAEVAVRLPRLRSLADAVLAPADPAGAPSPADVGSVLDRFGGESAAAQPPRVDRADAASSGAEPTRAEPARAELLAQIHRDAHTLGSSAVVVGEAAAARCARELEAELAAGSLSDVPARVELLHVLLAGWTT